jgi:hypothetical protein
MTEWQRKGGPIAREAGHRGGSRDRKLLKDVSAHRSVAVIGITRHPVEADGPRRPKDPVLRVVRTNRLFRRAWTLAPCTVPCAPSCVVCPRNLPRSLRHIWS